MIDPLKSYNTLGIRRLNLLDRSRETHDPRVLLDLARTNVAYALARVSMLQLNESRATPEEIQNARKELGRMVRTLNFLRIVYKEFVNPRCRQAKLAL